MIQTNFIPLKQKGIQLYLIKLTVEELIRNSSVVLFNPETGEGYQRPPIPSHYKRFAEYLRKNDRVLLPLGVLTATDPDRIEVNGLMKIRGPLRIVDGQHRLEGFKHLALNNPTKYQEFKEFELPVTIMVIDKDHEVDEIDTFINLNSKAKKISTDLAIRLRHERRKEKHYTRDLNEIIEDIAIKVTKNLNSDRNSPWFKAITMAPDERGRIISLNAFRKSLIPLVELFLSYYMDPKDIEDGFFIFENGEPEHLALNNEDTLIMLEQDEEKFVKLIKSFIDSIWSTVKHKWSDCFNMYEPYFNKEYNIQKGIGLYSIHLAVEDCIKLEKNTDAALYSFRNIIHKSRIKTEDWESGGNFSGNNSQSGFRLIANKIKEIKVD